MSSRVRKHLVIRVIDLLCGDRRQKKGVRPHHLRLFDDDNCDFYTFFCISAVFVGYLQKKTHYHKIVYFNYFDNGSSLTLIKSVIIV